MDVRGMGTSALIAVIAIIIVAAGAIYVAFMPEGEKMMKQGEEMMHDGEQMMKDGEKMMDDGEHMMKDGEKMMDDGTSAMMEGEYRGTLLGDTAALPLLDFTQVDYEQAIQEGKLVVLYFYANWCPICQAEFPKMVDAFNTLPTISSTLFKDVVGFRVNFNDTQTDSDEKALAREFGVAYQHTKIFVKNGERILKSPEEWDRDRYIEEIKIT